jgi:hypothetical protein
MAVLRGCSVRRVLRRETARADCPAGTLPLRKLLMRNRLPTILTILALGAASGCTSISSNYTGAMTVPQKASIVACHGHNCTFKTSVALDAAAQARFAAIMAPGAKSAEAERAAIGKADQYYEELSFAAIGVRDQPQSGFSTSGKRGQMDCIDESTNTRSLLRYLDARGLLKYHSVQGNVSRGVIFDGRYPHSTAVIRDKATGIDWVVDSWYSQMGGAPDIFHLKDWLPRGFMQSGALNS